MCLLLCMCSSFCFCCCCCCCFCCCKDAVISSNFNYHLPTKCPSQKTALPLFRSLSVLPGSCVHANTQTNTRAHKQTHLPTHAAFGAPIGGVVFAIEQVSSFYSLNMLWHAAVAAGIALYTTLVWMGTDVDPGACVFACV